MYWILCFYHNINIIFLIFIIIFSSLKLIFFQCILFLVVAAPIATALNYLLPDCNFFFTYSGSKGSPLEILIRIFGEPWWLAAYAILVMLVLGAEFLPWHLAERKRKERVN